MLAVSSVCHVLYLESPVYWHHLSLGQVLSILRQMCYLSPNTAITNINTKATLVLVHGMQLVNFWGGGID